MKTCYRFIELPNKGTRRMVKLMPLLLFWNIFLVSLVHPTVYTQKSPVDYLYTMAEYDGTPLVVACEKNSWRPLIVLWGLQAFPRSTFWCGHKASGAFWYHSLPGRPRPSFHRSSYHQPPSAAPQRASLLKNLLAFYSKFVVLNQCKNIYIYLCY